MSRTYHVATTGSDLADGTAEAPFRTINRAARAAMPGDTVSVHEGTYREWVKPERGGISDTRRITYQAAPGEHVVITGAEQVTGWEPEGDGVWKVTLPNEMFNGFNPFAEEINGDWIVYPSIDAPRKHLGDVYLDGRSFYEAASRDEVAAAEIRETVVDHWTHTTVPVLDPDQTRYVWYAEVADHTTTVWANFHDADPNESLVEVNVRRSVFYPTRTHLNWITVRGFELAQAASPWTPPTADQPGLIGPNWAKGWIIEDNLIHDAKCSAISLGKEASTGHNFATERKDKPGYQYQLESVFSARRIGWDKEHIGSHVVRRNTIRDCGQNGVVGHLGCVFSTIEDNHIYNIAIKREFFGHEIGGIKLHAALDVAIRRNRIHHCSLGVWLDWQTQGTRVSRNLLHDNSRDLFIEVSHGPYLVDHNVLASPVSLENFSQGGAYVNNLLAGTVAVVPVVERPTPYHVPHSTQVAGYAAIVGGDDRFVGNIFLGGDDRPAYGPTHRFVTGVGHGTGSYDGHPATMHAYLELLQDPTKGDHERFIGIKQPAYIHDNAYLGGATPFESETRATVLDGDATVRVVEEGDEVYLELSLPAGLADATSPVLSGLDLPLVRFVDAEFEEPDGTPARIDVDLRGVQKDQDKRYPVGPLAELGADGGRVRVW